jgi:outer membrane lipoprotein-sorting protein
METISRAAVAVLLVCLAAPPLRGADVEPTPSAEEARPAAKRPTLEELPPDLQMVLRQLDEANEGLEDATAKVTYEREIPLLESKQKSRGTLVYMAPDLLALKLGKPRNEEVRTNGKLWWVISHDDKQVEIYQAAEGDQGAPDDGEDGETLYRLEFVPVERPDEPARYEMIEAVIGSGVWLPQTIVLHEEGDEIVHTYSLRDIRLNTGVERESFEYTPPRGYNVVTLDEF